MQISKVFTIRLLLVLVREIAAKCGRSVPDTEVRIAFENFGCLMEGYIPAKRDIDLGKRDTRDDSWKWLKISESNHGRHVWGF